MLKSWAETAPELIDVAARRKFADMVVRNGKRVNVHSGEIIAGTDVAIISGRVAYVSPAATHAIGPGTAVIEAAGRYMVPGLGRPHSCRKRPCDGDGIRARGDPAWHHLDVH